jgi:nucleotide-binding universal stress UspA family protein
MFQHILVPLDGGDLSRAALRAACALAKECGARLTFYHAKPIYVPTYLAGEMLVADPSLDQAIRQATQRQSNAMLEEATQLAKQAEVASDTLSDERDAPHAGIIAAAEALGCDLIFMASHGRRGVNALLLGSETQKVLTHCKVPVLVYR